MKFTIHQESRIGGRASNQDRLLYRYSHDTLLMIVADGMGGHAHGEIAAQIATVRIAKFFEQNTMPRINDPAQFLADALLDAHDAVKTLTSRQPRPPHTTCVVCVVQDSHAWWAHVGDSRFYLLRDGNLLARTRDHSYVEGLLQRGLISREEAMHHPQRNLVLSCLGARELPHIECADRSLQAGDVLLLCTDGVWEPLGDQALIGAFDNDDITTAAPRALDLAERNAGDNGDNLTLIAMRWEDSAKGPGTISRFPDTVLDPHSGTSPALLSDEEINRTIADIRNRLKP
jgi:serine/threonine protein phosphatase PrpC